MAWSPGGHSPGTDPGGVPGGLGKGSTNASVTGVVDSKGNPVGWGPHGQQVGFGPGLLSKDTPFANQALQAALADPNSPSHGAAQTAVATNPEVAQRVRMFRQRQVPTYNYSYNIQPYTSSIDDDDLSSFLTTKSLMQQSEEDDDTTLGLSLSEAIAKDLSDMRERIANIPERIANIPSSIYGVVTDPIGTLERAVESPVGQYSVAGLPSIGPTAIGLSMANFSPSFNEQGETIGTGYLGGLGVSTHLGYDTDNYGLDNEQDRVAFERSFYNALYSPDPDSVKGYTVDAEAAQDVADQFGATYSGPDVSTQAPDRGGPETEALPTEQITEQIYDTPPAEQIDYQSLYDQLSPVEKETADKIIAMEDYDIAYAVDYILSGGPLF